MSKANCNYKIINLEEKGNTRGEAKRIGKFTVLKEIGLKEEIHCFNYEKNEHFLFEPAVQLIKMDRPTILKDTSVEVRFGYYTTAKGGNRIWGGQTSLIVNENQLVALLEGMIKYDYFSQNSLCQLNNFLIERKTKSA